MASRSRLQTWTAASVWVGLRPWSPKRLLLFRALWAWVGVDIGFGFGDAGEVFWFDLCGFAVFAPDGVVNFFAMDADRFGGGDTESHFIPADIDDCDFNIVADNNRLVLLTGQHQHCWLLPGQRGLN